MNKHTLRFLSFLFITSLCFGHIAIAQSDLKESLSECKSLEDDQPQQAIALADSILSQMSKEENTVIYGQFLGCAAWAYANNNEINEAQNKATELEALSTQLDASEDKVDLLRRTGSIFHRTGNRIAAVDNYQKAMDMAESLNLKKPQIAILSNLGVLNSQIREHELAIANYYLALKLMAELGDNSYQAPVLFNLAITLNGEGRYAESLPLLEQVEAMINDHWPNSRVAQVYTGLAVAHNALDSHNLALAYIEKALALFSKESIQSIEYYGTLVAYAEVLIALNQPETALQQADTAWQYYQLDENREQLLSVNNPLYALANVYESVNKPLKALAVRKLAAEIDAEFQDSFNKEAMAQMQARLSDSQQRKELAELKAQQAKDKIELIAAQHNRQLTLMLVVFGSILVLAFLFWQRRVNKRLHAISIRDSLTQLGNRRAIREWMANRKFPQAPKVRLMWLIDLDLFKHINDQYGHEAGDEVLIGLAKTMLACTNDQRFVGRWGGEEFMLITDDVSMNTMVDFCDHLLSAIAQTEINYQGKIISVTASVGVSQMKGTDKKAWHEALTTADKALYRAKDKGRNCVICGDIKTP